MNNFHTSILRKFSPEFAHSLTIKLLRLKFLTNFGFKKKSDDIKLHQHIFGLDFTNPIGLAAGFDKNAEVIEPLFDFGFGFVEAGTVTPKSQYGNQKPRLFRLHEDKALINHLGFNNSGVDIVKKNLSKLNLGSFNKGIVGINIGKNKNSSNAIDDYCYCLEKLGSSAHYVTINISSPNTPGLRNLQNRGQIENLVKSLHRIREKNSDLTNKSLLLKISPDLDDEQLRDIALMSLALNVDGLIISNSTIKRYANLTSKNQNEVGGLSGKPLFIDSTLLLKKMYNLTNGQIPLIGVGGISNGIECYNKIKAGASLVQLYTALVYNSPILIKYMKNEMLSCLNIDGFKNIKEVIGKDS